MREECKICNADTAYFEIIYYKMGLKACHDEQMCRIELSCYHVISIPQGACFTPWGEHCLIRSVKVDLCATFFGTWDMYILHFFFRIGASFKEAPFLKRRLLVLYWHHPIWVFHQGKIANPIINTKIRLEICQKIYRTEDFRVKNLHRKRVIFDIC